MKLVKNMQCYGSGRTDLRFKSKVQLYIMCAIPMLLVFIFNYIPIFGIIIAFKNYNYDKGILGSEWVGLKNFEIFYHSNEFAKIAWNTVYLNIIFIFAGMICSIALALVLYEITSRNKVKFYQTVMITPYFLSWVVVGYMAYALLNPEYGFLNRIITAFGAERVQWYSKPNLWPAILTTAFVWKSVGMDMILYYAALMGVDSQLFEAAEIDGASKLKSIWHITIPSIIPIIIILLILKIGGIFRADFGLFYQLTRDVGALYSTTDVMDTYIFRTMRVLGDMSISSAAGFLQSVVGFALVVITNTLVKHIDKDYTLF